MRHQADIFDATKSPSPFWVKRRTRFVVGQIAPLSCRHYSTGWKCRKVKTVNFYAHKTSNKCWFKAGSWPLTDFFLGSIVRNKKRIKMSDFENLAGRKNISSDRDLTILETKLYHRLSKHPVFRLIQLCTTHRKKLK